MEPTTKEEMAVVISNNELIGRFMEVTPEEEYVVANDDAIRYSPKNTGYYDSPYRQKKECESFLEDNPIHKEQGFRVEKREWWPWYNQDWNKLMECWYKFLGLRFSGHNDSFKHAEIKTTVGYAIIYGDINLAYQRLVEAINWYNSTKQ